MRPSQEKTEQNSTTEEIDPAIEHRVFGLSELHFSQKVNKYKEWKVEKFIEEITTSLSSFLSVKHYPEAIKQEINRICSENKIFAELKQISQPNDDEIISRVKAFHFA